jgi:hypothetical protein
VLCYLKINILNKKINIMKNIKDITLSIFAVIGFVALLSSFTQEVVYTEKQISNGTPESHVWELIVAKHSSDDRVYGLNKVTGEVRKYSRGNINESFYVVVED